MSRDLIQLSTDIWLYPLSPTPTDVQPNIGVIRADEQTVLIDAGNGAHHADDIKTTLYQAGFPTVGTIIYTHHHWDHVFGAAAFNPQRIIAHTLCRERLQERAVRDWSPHTLRAESELQPFFKLRNDSVLASLEAWGTFRVCMPNIVFSGTFTLYIDDLQIDLIHVGGVHAPDSLIVRAGEVLFVADSYYPPPLPERTPENDKLDISMLESFLESDAQIFVDGHGLPRSRDELRDLIADERARQIAQGQW